MSKHVRGWGWSLLCLALVGAGCQERDQPPPPETESKNRWSLRGRSSRWGDSLTAGLGVAQEDAYPALLERRLATAGYRYRVINAGVSGETTSGALSRTQWVLKLKPDIVILESGANDGLRGIEPQLIARNLTQMVERFAAAGVTVVLAGMKMPLNLGPEYARDFAAVYPAVAAEQGVILVPFFPGRGSAAGGRSTSPTAFTRRPKATGGWWTMCFPAWVEGDQSPRANAPDCRRVARQAHVRTAGDGVHRRLMDPRFVVLTVHLE